MYYDSLVINRPNLTLNEQVESIYAYLCLNFNSEFVPDTTLEFIQ